MPPVGPAGSIKHHGTGRAPQRPHHSAAAGGSPGRWEVARWCDRPTLSGKHLQHELPGESSSRARSVLPRRQVVFRVHHRLSVKDFTGSPYGCQLVFEFLDATVRIPQSLALSRGHTLGDTGIHPPLRLPPVQRLLQDTVLSNNGQNTFSGEHAINQPLPESRWIPTRHNDPLPV